MLARCCVIAQPSIPLLLPAKAVLHNAAALIEQFSPDTSVEKKKARRSIGINPAGVADGPAICSHCLEPSTLRTTFPCQSAFSLLGSSLRYGAECFFTMARALASGASAAAGAGAGFGALLPPWVVVLGVALVSVWAISLAVVLCSDSSEKKKKEKEKEKKGKAPRAGTATTTKPSSSGGNDAIFLAALAGASSSGGGGGAGCGGGGGGGCGCACGGC